MHCNVAKVFLDAHLKSKLYKNKAWISLDISEAFYGFSFSNYFVKSGVYVWIDRRLKKDFQLIMYVQSLRIISFDAPAFAIKKMKPVSVKLVFWFVNPLIVSITYTHCTKHWLEAQFFLPFGLSININCAKWSDQSGQGQKANIFYHGSTKVNQVLKSDQLLTIDHKIVIPYFAKTAEKTRGPLSR